MRDDRIFKGVDRATHIWLKCKCGARGFMTKNIEFIGARSIFYHGEPGGSCPCPGRDLRVDEELSLLPYEKAKERLSRLSTHLQESLVGEFGHSLREMS